jgi:hypothetical protein
VSTEEAQQAQDMVLGMFLASCHPAIVLFDSGAFHTGVAQQAQDVVLGMFLTNSHPATVLFDSGASHSFISSAIVAKHQLPMTIMKHPVLVSS